MINSLLHFTLVFVDGPSHWLCINNEEEWDQEGDDDDCCQEMAPNIDAFVVKHE